LFFCALVLAAPALAEAPPPVADGILPPQQPLDLEGDAPDVGALLTRIAVAFGVVMVGLAVVLWVVKRVSTGPARGRSGLLEIIETRAVMPRWSVSVVRFGEEILLVSHAGDDVTVLSSARGDALPPPAPEAAKPAGDAFTGWLADALRRKPARARPEEEKRA
jgi:flagellar biogenesis protein FliO